MTRKTYTKTFKLRAVDLVLQTEMPVTVAARKMNIHHNTLYRWVNAYKEHGEEAFDEAKQVANPEQELTALRRENRDLKQQVDLLKKFHDMLEQKEADKFEFIKEYSDLITVSKACELFSVSRSGYYKYLAHSPVEGKDKDIALEKNATKQTTKKQTKKRKRQAYLRKK